MLELLLLKLLMVMKLVSLILMLDTEWINFWASIFPGKSLPEKDDESFLKMSPLNPFSSTREVSQLRIEVLLEIWTSVWTLPLQHSSMRSNCYGIKYHIRGLS